MKPITPHLGLLLAGIAVAALATVGMSHSWAASHQDPEEDGEWVTLDEEIERASPVETGPGPEHEPLHRLVGSWKVRATFHAQASDSPDGPWAPEEMVFSGTAKNGKLFGGRFLMSEVSLEHRGEHLLILGFDRSSKEYFQLELSNGWTGFSASVGGPEGEGIAMKEIAGPGDGRMSLLLSQESQDKYMVEQFHEQPGGAVKQVAVFEYFRQK
ncbi:MAG: DUF1579 domain-containing protein [bacterium]|nr:DUF1579 domain-containing protein [bacterium]